MPNTPTYDFPYPAVTDAPDGPTQIQALAGAVEDEIERIDASLGTVTPVTNWTTYLPIVFGAGSGTFTTRSGRWRRIGPKTVAFSVYFKMATDGTGTSNVNIALPTVPNRAIRQTIAGHSEGPGAVLQAVIYTSAEGGSGNLTDRILLTNSATTGSLNGSAGNAPLMAGQECTITGVYEEA